MGSRQQMLLIGVRNSPLHTPFLGNSSETNLGGEERDRERRDDRRLWRLRAVATLQQDSSSARREKGTNHTSALEMLCFIQDPGSMGALSQQQHPPLIWPHCPGMLQTYPGTSINTTAQPPCRGVCAAQAMPCCWQGTHKGKGSSPQVFLMRVETWRREAACPVKEGTRETGASLGTCTESKSPQQRGQGTTTKNAHTVALRLGSSLAEQ